MSTHQQSSPRARITTLLLTNLLMHRALWRLEYRCASDNKQISWNPRAIWCQRNPHDNPSRVEKQLKKATVAHTDGWVRLWSVLDGTKKKKNTASMLPTLYWVLVSAWDMEGILSTGLLQAERIFMFFKHVSYHRLSYLCQLILASVLPE